MFGFGQYLGFLGPDLDKILFLASGIDQDFGIQFFGLWSAAAA